MKQLCLRIVGSGLLAAATFVLASALLGGPAVFAGDLAPSPTPDPCAPVAPTPTATGTVVVGVIQAFQAPPSPTPCVTPTEGPPKTHTPTPQTPTSTPPPTTSTPPPPPPPATSTPAGGAGGGVTPPDTGSGGSAAAGGTPMIEFAVAAAMLATGGVALGVSRKAR